MNHPVQISGSLDPAFKRVKDAFATGFEKGLELGAALSIVVNGKVVVSLWGGFCDKEKARPWREDTLANVFSTTKGMTALCAHKLVDQGKLDLDAPVAKYWPEFAQVGKEKIPVRYLLNHRSGLPAVKNLLPMDALFNWKAMTSALAAETPWWEPGTKHGYHAITFGWLVGEVIRRISGKTVGEFFRDEIAGPLGADFHIGTEEKLHGRVARMSQIRPSQAGGAYKKEQFNLVEIILKNPQGVTARAFANPPSMAEPGVVNTSEWRTAEIPAANGHTSAKGLATIYGNVAKFLSPASLARCYTQESHGPDEVLKFSTRFGSGFMLSQDLEEAWFSPNARSFGHPGAGGSLGFADLDAKVGFGYVMNRMGLSIIVDPRPGLVAKALYESL
ncbi:MAG: serine hydrolase domain-containing protein [Bdellovibrionota bacterium]